MPKRSSEPGRHFANWIEAYEEHLAESESADSYIKWSGIFAVSAAMGRTAYFKRNHSIIHPNQFICLIGPSGNRKAEPVMTASRLLTSIGMSLIPDSITRQMLYRHIKNKNRTWTDPEGNLGQEHCEAVGAFEEFGVFLGQDQDPKFLADLTNWYDCRDTWKYETKNQGKDHIAGVCLNMLGAMAPDWIPRILTGVAFGGGFTSRIIFVVETEKRKTISDPDIIAERSGLEEQLIEDLAAITLIQGRFQFSPEAKDLYMDWYEEVDIAAPAITDQRFQGYNARRPTHVLKIGMALSAAEGKSKVISAENFREAVSLLEETEKRMPTVFDGLGMSRLTNQQQLVQHAIKTIGVVKRSELLQIVQADVDLRTLIEVIEQLKALHHIEVQAGTDPTYTWKGKTNSQEEAHAGTLRYFQ